MRTDEFWDKNKVKLFLSLCLENKFCINPNNKQKTLWNEICPIIGTSPDECSKKYRNLRRTYIRLLKKKRQGKDIKWIYYGLCEEIFKDCKSLTPSVLEIWDDHKIHRLLTLYVENLNRFRNSNCLKKDIWKEIATVLETTEYSCYHKFKNLKRTYFSWLERNRESGRLIKWPYHQYFERIFYNYNPAIGPWSKQKIKQLLDAYAQISYKFRNPKYQKKELWKEIAAQVGEKSTNCDRKFRNLKQTYIKLKLKADTGRGISKWRYYKDFEAIYGFNSSTGDESSQRLITRIQEEDYVIQLLSFYLENRDKFNDPKVKNRTLWRFIGKKIGLTWEECDKKFRNLKQTYIRLSEKRKQTGKSNNWPYYSYFEAIFDENIIPKNKECFNKSNLDDVALTEIKKLVHEVQDRKDNDRKFEKLMRVAEESNNIQKERNRILQALLDRK